MEKGTSIISVCRLSPRAILPDTYLLAIVLAGILFSSCCAEQGPAAAGMAPAGTVRTILSIQTDYPTKSVPSWRLIRSLQTFSFEDSGSMALDSYSLDTEPDGSRIEMLSGKGIRRVVIIANAFEGIDASKISCYEDLKQMEYIFADEDPEHPLLCGECRVKAGDGGINAIRLSPLLAVLDVNGISSEPDLHDVSIYLINASNRCALFPEGAVHPSEFINAGSLKESDMQKMAHPRMVHRYLGEGSRTNGITHYAGACLYCYPNNAEEESAGSHFTKVVIEGLLDGRKVQYEIPVNQSGYGYSDADKGICVGTRYSIDVTIGNKK